MASAELVIPDNLFDPARPPADAQRAAVETAAKNRVMVLTGGPGTGKTFTTNSIVQMLKSNGLDVALAAPTGKAAIRMREQTGENATTIHRLLGWTPDGWTYDATQEVVELPDGKRIGGPLPHDVIVLDEVSMIDTELMMSVMRALTPSQRLVMVGDVDQLPSIGAGQVLRDLIDSGRVPVVRLTQIFRQAEESRIPYIAQEVRDGRIDTPVTELKLKEGGVGFSVQEDAEHVAQVIVAAVVNAKDPAGVQVLCPQKVGDIGAERLNRDLQRKLNPRIYKDEGMKCGSADYRLHVGDRVIHTKNNYEIAVANGEIGVVLDADFKGINPARFEARLSPDVSIDGQYVMAVDYGDRVVLYRKLDVFELDLGYAITIHKSQGSQFDYVVTPVHEANEFMLTRQLLYTAVTRAVDGILLVGQEKMLHTAASNERGLNRRTKLQARLEAA